MIEILIYRAILLFGSIMLGAAVEKVLGPHYGYAVFGALLIAAALEWERRP